MKTFTDQRRGIAVKVKVGESRRIVFLRLIVLGDKEIG